MSKFRKILVAAVVLSMVLSLVGTGFAAAPKVVTKVFSDTEGKDCEEAMAMLGGLGIYKGDSGIGGPARPDDPITRAEVSAVVTRMLGKEKTAKAMENYAPPFVDAAQIPSWAWGYVSVASSLGIVKGYPDGSFKAGNNVTHAEMLAMLVRALGHDSLVKGVWPTNYIVYGHSLGLTDGVDVFANLPATRGEVAMMAANAMEADVYDEVAEEVLEGESLLTGKLRSGFDSVEGTVVSVDVDNAEIKIRADWDKDDKTPDDEKTKDLASQVVLVGVDELDNLENLDVLAVMVDDEVVYIEVTEEADVVTGVLEARDDFDATDKVITLDGEDEYDFTTDTMFYVNNQEVGDYEDFGDWLDAEVNNKTKFDRIEGDLVLTITLNEDADAVAVKAEYYDIYDGYLKDDPEEASDKDKKNDILATIETDDGSTVKIMKNTKVQLNDEAAEWDDLEKDMSIYVMLEGGSGDKAWKVAAYDDIVTGDVVSVRRVSAGYYTVKLEVDDKETTYKTSKKFTEAQADDLTGLVTVGLNAKGEIRVVLEAEAAKDYVLVKDLIAENENEPLETLVVDRLGEEEFIDLKEAGVLTVDSTSYTDVVMVGEAVYNKPTSDSSQLLFTVDSFIELSDVTGGGELRGVKVADLITEVKDSETVPVEFEVYRIYLDDKIVVIEDAAGKRYVVDSPAVYDEDLDFIGIEDLDKEDIVHAYALDTDDPETTIVLVKQ